MKKKKLTADDLALYLSAGIKVQFQRFGEHLYRGELVGCGCDSIQLRNVIGPYAGVSDYRIFNEEHFKPILRPLSDMTEEECEQWYDSQNHIPFADQYKDIKRAAAQTAWLLQNGIDVFGWIDAGLAIDKTKMETP